MSLLVFTAVFELIALWTITTLPDYFTPSPTLIDTVHWCPTDYINGQCLINISNENVPRATFTTETKSAESAKWCLNDCINGACVVDIIDGNLKLEACRLYVRASAPTFFTMKVMYPSRSTCSSRCDLISGDPSYRCAVDNDWSKLDYCNHGLRKDFEYRDFTVDIGPCKDDCVNGRCHDIADIPRSCIEDKYLYETMYTIEGLKCNGECKQHQGKTYDWCAASGADKGYCATTAVYFSKCAKCATTKKIYRSVPQDTVEQYARRKELDPATTTLRFRDPNNPIYQVTYTETIVDGTTVKLPLVVRALIFPSHIKPSNTRGHNFISRDAKTNCQRMGLIDGVDVVGHLIPHKLGGPTNFYNFVPMTHNINIGQVSSGHVYNPSVWVTTERELSDLLETFGGSVSMNIVLTYNSHSQYPLRPTFIGFDQFRHNLNVTCKNYWFNNDPNSNDTDCHHYV